MTNVSSSETLGLRCDYTNLQNATQNKHNTETNTHTAKLCLNVRGKKIITEKSPDKNSGGGVEEHTSGGCLLKGFGKGVGTKRKREGHPHLDSDVTG